MKNAIIIGIVLSVPCATQAMKNKRQQNFSKQNKKERYYCTPIPRGDRWNTLHGKFVIEVEDPNPSDKKAILKTIAPEGFSKTFSTLNKPLFIQCKNEKNARSLSQAEYLGLIHALLPNRNPPKGLEFLKNSDNWSKDYSEWKNKNN